jgi:hypothetical protein
VKNTGDQELRIERVRPACSCTKVELKKDTLAPGESAEMTGSLTTKDVEGVMSKGIPITSNDPAHQITMAILSIRFPYNGQGLRITGNPRPTSVRLRDGALWAYMTIENCEPDKPAQIEAMELPAGWDCSQTLPIAVAPEDRVGLTLTRQVAAGSEPQAFDSLPFTLVTDSAKTPRLRGTLLYHPAAPPAPATAPAAPPAAGAVGSAVAPTAPAAATPPAAPPPIPPVTPAAGAKPAP